MSQKDYKMGIILELLKGEKHVRALAKALKTNPTTISRKIHELLESNAVDYKPEGRNKVFFMRGTEEARSYVVMAEQYKLLQLLAKHGSLRMFFRKIQKDERITLAMLFGSYAKGLEKSGSDIDIYVDSTDRQIKRDLQLLDSKLSVKLGKYDRQSLLIKEIVKNHVIIKGVEEFYEKSGILEGVEP